MKRQVLWLLVVLGCGSLTGCEWLHQGMRHKSVEVPAESSEEKPGAVESTAPKGFFKSSRLPGAWSDEGREIEKDLGVR